MGGSIPALPIFAFIFPDESVTHRVLWLLGGLVLLSAWIAYGIYLFRGQGPSTASIEERLKAAEGAAKVKRRAADKAWKRSRRGWIGQPPQLAPPTHVDATSAQINAIAHPETAKALQNLQNLLYTRALTDAEYQAAKDKLLGPRVLNDSFAQVAKLAELHRDGVLGDVEFAAAKARVLGL